MPGTPVWRNLTRIDLEVEISIDNPLCPGGGADRGVGGIDTGYRGHEPVRLRQVKALVESEGHDRGRGAQRALARDNSQHLLLGVVTQRTIAQWKRDGLRQRQALHPGLEFARRVARIVTELEGRDHHDPHWQLTRILCAHACDTKQRHEAAAYEPA